jgi:LuxR family transcriptional regulator, maltose regulon positive regulatory protein
VADGHLRAESSPAADAAGHRSIGQAGSASAGPAIKTAARTRPPPVRPGAIRRDQLLRRFAAAGQEARLILVVAPTGYGKTTALSQLAEATDEPSGWVQVDESDNDPRCLVRAVAFALAGTHPVGEVMDALASPGDDPVDGAVAALAAAIRSVDKPTVIVLDDLHLVRTSAALDAVVSLAASLPSDSHLVAASQRPLRMRLGRPRSRGQLAEFGARDLAFTDNESRQLLARLGVDIPERDLQPLLAKSEGWPAGIYLAGLSVASRLDPVSAARELGGSTRFIVDYFRDEVLTRQSIETVSFLLLTSVLDEMSGPLCDAVLDTTGSAAWLAEIEALNLFIVPQDGRGEWYRYHRLFAEMLRSELRRRRPAEEHAIRRRAAAWFEKQGNPEQAIRYALAGEDSLLAARLITAHAQRFHSEGRIGLVRSWLDALDEDVLRSYPPVATMGGWIWAATGDPARAHRSLHLAESATFDGKLPDQSASMESAVARLRAGLAPDGLEVMLSDAKRALDLEPPESPWHPQAALLYGTACLLTGARDEAVSGLERAARLGRNVAPPTASVALAQRSLLAADEGDWSTAEACAAESWELVEKAALQTSLASLLTYLACARTALHGGDTEAAWNDTVAALRLYRRPSPVALAWLAAQTAMILARILRDLGDERAAQLRAGEARRHLGSLQTEGVLREQYLQLRADLDRTGGRSKVGDATTLTTAELRILRLLRTHLSLAGIAQDLVVSRNTVKTQVASIYRKLAVANRTEAVRRADEMGLFDG